MSSSSFFFIAAVAVSSVPLSSFLFNKPALIVSGACASTTEFFAAACAVFPARPPVLSPVVLRGGTGFICIVVVLLNTMLEGPLFLRALDAD